MDVDLLEYTEVDERHSLRVEVHESTGSHGTVSLDTRMFQSLALARTQSMLVDGKANHTTVASSPASFFDDAMSGSGSMRYPADAEKKVPLHTPLRASSE